MTREQLGKRISELRFKQFGSMTKAAPVLGMSAQLLSLYEKGRIKNVDVYWLMKISTIFGVNLLAEIQEGEHNENTPHHARGAVNSNLRND